MISLQQMYYVLAVFENKSFQKASEVCFVTQPTLSMQVKKAEETLGQLIFDRSRNPIELTAYGKHLVPILSNVLEENQKILHLKDRLSNVLEEQLKIGIIPTVAAYMLPDLFETWIHELPHISLDIKELRTHELIHAIENKTLDLAIMAGPYAQPGLNSSILYEEEICVYAPHLSNDYTSKNSLIQEQPWLLSKGNCLRNQMINFCKLEEGESTVKWNYEGGNVELLMQMAEKLGGYTLVPRHFHALKTKQQHIKKILVDGIPVYPGRTILGVFSARSAKVDLIHKLIHCIQNHYQLGAEQQLELINWNA